MTFESVYEDDYIHPCIDCGESCDCGYDGHPDFGCESCYACVNAFDACDDEEEDWADDVAELDARLTVTGQ